MKQTVQKGFTLVELVVTIGIIGIIGSALAVFIVDNFRFQSMTITEGQSLGESQRAVDEMKRVLRGATFGENGAYPVGNAEPQTLTIYSDYDYDGQVEKVRYYLDGTNMYRGTTEPQAAADVYPEGQETSELITNDVDNGEEPIFYYYGTNYTGSEDPLDPVVEPAVKAIGIHLIINTTPYNDEGKYVNDTSVHLRNL